MIGPRARSRWNSLAGVGRARSASALALSAPLLALFVEYESLSFNVHKGESAVGVRADPARFSSTGGPVLQWSAAECHVGRLGRCRARGTGSEGRSSPSLRRGCVTNTWRQGWSCRSSARRGAAAGQGVRGRHGRGSVELPVVERSTLPLSGSHASGSRCRTRRGARASTAFDEAGSGAPGSSAGSLSLSSADTPGARQNRTTLQCIPGDQIVRQVGLAGLTFVAIVVVVLAVRKADGAYAVVGLVIVELVVLAPNPFAERRDPYVAPAWLEVWRGELADRPTDRIFGLDTMLYPNTGAAHGLYDIRMLDALHVDRYYEYIRTFMPLEYTTVSPVQTSARTKVVLRTATTRCSISWVCGTSCPSRNRTSGAR